MRDMNDRMRDGRREGRGLRMSGPGPCLQHTTASSGIHGALPAGHGAIRALIAGLVLTTALAACRFAPPRRWCRHRRATARRRRPRLPLPATRSGRRPGDVPAKTPPTTGGQQTTPSPETTPEAAPETDTTDDGADTDAAESPKDRCDSLASDPLDDDRRRDVDVVEWDDLDPGGAIAACSEALAAEPNILRLKYQLARAYEKNTDYAQSVKLYRELSDRGYAAGIAGLAYAYENGEGLEKDEAQAFAWYTKGAQRNNAWSMFNLAKFYDEGRQVPEDDQTALAWYVRAAELGNARAMTDAGFLLETTTTDLHDLVKAREWYTKGAEAGNDVGMANLANFLMNGTGGPKDLEGAFKWYKAASDLGNMDAPTGSAISITRAWGWRRMWPRACASTRSRLTGGAAQPIPILAMPPRPASARRRTMPRPMSFT